MKMLNACKGVWEQASLHIVSGSEFGNKTLWGSNLKISIRLLKNNITKIGRASCRERV